MVSTLGYSIRRMTLKRVVRVVLPTLLIRATFVDVGHLRFVHEVILHYLCARGIGYELPSLLLTTVCVG